MYLVFFLFNYFALDIATVSCRRLEDMRVMKSLTRDVMDRNERIEETLFSILIVWDVARDIGAAVVLDEGSRYLYKLTFW